MSSHSSHRRLKSRFDDSCDQTTVSSSAISSSTSSTTSCGKLNSSSSRHRSEKVPCESCKKDCKPSKLKECQRCAKTVCRKCDWTCGLCELPGCESCSKQPAAYVSCEDCHQSTPTRFCIWCDRKPIFVLQKCPVCQAFKCKKCLITGVCTTCSRRPSHEPLPRTRRSVPTCEACGESRRSLDYIRAKMRFCSRLYKGTCHGAILCDDCEMEGVDNYCGCSGPNCYGNYR